nr:hypothetical protein [Streptomyces sp. M1013]
MLACWFGVDRSTLTQAIGEVRPLLAEWGCTVRPDVRLRTLAKVVDHLGASGTIRIIDGTETGSGARLSGARAGTSSSPARASRTPSWPMGPRWRSLRMPATRAWAGRPVDGW